MTSQTSSPESSLSGNVFNIDVIGFFYENVYRHSGKELDAMKAVALSAKNRSLSEFQQAVKDFKVELEDDLIVNKHLDSLYNNMLEQNLCRSD